MGNYDAVELDDRSCRAVYLSEGIGHAFLALSDNTVMSYLCSTPYSPGREHGVSPLDQDLALPWPVGIEPVLSEKDAAASTVVEAEALSLCQPGGRAGQRVPGVA